MRCVGRHGVLVNVGEIWVLGVSTGDEVLPEFETKHSLHIMCCSFVFWARRLDTDVVYPGEHIIVFLQRLPQPLE